MYKRKGVFPSPDQSRRLWRRLWRLPRLNPSFPRVVGATYFVLALLAGWFAEASRATHTAKRCDTALVPCLTGTLAADLCSLGVGAALAVLLRVLGGFASKAGRRQRWWLGTVHLVGHVIVLLALAVVFSSVAAALDWRGWTTGLGLLATVAMGGALVGSLVMAGYLWATNRFLHVHDNEAYSAIRVAEYKNFLRLHIDSEGTLTIFPIGLARICSTWVARPDGAPDTPWFVPADGGLDPHLIEPPIRVDGHFEGGASARA